MIENTSGWYNRANSMSSLNKQALNFDDIKKYVQIGGAATMLGLSPLQQEPSALGAEKGKQRVNQPAKANAGTPSDDELEQFIGNWEGIRPEAYKDSEGNWTVGIGFNLERSDAKSILQGLGLSKSKLINKQQSLSPDQISKLFAINLKTAKADALAWCPNLYEHPIEIQKIIIDFAFNLGATKLRKFPKAQEAFANKDYRRAAAEMKDSTWYGQVGRRSKHHVKTVGSYAE